MDAPSTSGELDAQLGPPRKRGRPRLLQQGSISDLLDNSDVDLSGSDGDEDFLANDKPDGTYDSSDSDDVPLSEIRDTLSSGIGEGDSFQRNDCKNWKWRKTNRFNPTLKEHEGTDPPPPPQRAGKYFEAYLSSDFFESMAQMTNQTEVERTGKSLTATALEIKHFIGISMAMSCLRYPQIRLFWSRNFRVPIVADTVTRDRFFQLRTRLKLVTDNDVGKEDKEKDRLWKMTSKTYQYRYAIVVFIDENSTDCIPSSWIINHSSALWPFHFSQSQIEKAIADCMKPESNWKTVAVKVLAHASSLKVAKELAKAALETSNISSEGEENSDKPRKLKPNPRYCTKSPELPKFPSKKTDMHVELQTISADISGKRKLGHGKRNHKRGSFSGGNSSQKNVTSVSDVDDDLTDIENLDFSQQSSSLFQVSPDVQDGTLTERSNTLQQTFSRCPSVAEQQILKAVESLRYDIKRTNNAITKLTDVVQEHVTKGVVTQYPQEQYEVFNLLLPLCNQSDLMEVEGIISDPQTREIFAQFLALKGGKDVKSLLKNILTALLRKDLALQYSGHGKKGKKSFKALLIYQAVLQAVRKCYPEASEYDLLKVVTSHLAGCGDKEGGRKARGNK